MRMEMTMAMTRKMVVATSDIKYNNKTHHTTGPYTTVL